MPHHVGRVLYENGPGQAATELGAQHQNDMQHRNQVPARLARDYAISRQHGSDPLSVCCRPGREDWLEGLAVWVLAT